jgi:hypothetical protein
MALSESHQALGYAAHIGHRKGKHHDDDGRNYCLLMLVVMIIFGMPTGTGTSDIQFTKPNVPYFPSSNTSNGALMRDTHTTIHHTQVHTRKYTCTSVPPPLAVSFPTVNTCPPSPPHTRSSGAGCRSLLKVVRGLYRSISMTALLLAVKPDGP